LKDKAVSDFKIGTKVRITNGPYRGATGESRGNLSASPDWFWVSFPMGIGSFFDRSQLEEIPAPTPQSQITERPNGLRAESPKSIIIDDPVVTPIPDFTPPVEVSPPGSVSPLKVCPACDQVRPTLPSGEWAKCRDCSFKGCSLCLPENSRRLCPECLELYQITPESR
jgi:hypothetical protein